MRKFMISMALVSASAVGVAATPAAAEVSVQRHHGGNNFQPGREIRRDINQLQNRINQAQRRGAISNREAVGLRRDVNRLEAQFSRFSRNGLDRREIGQLRAGINRVESRIRYERRDGNRGRR